CEDDGFQYWVDADCRRDPMRRRPCHRPPPPPPPPRVPVILDSDPHSLVQFVGGFATLAFLEVYGKPIVPAGTDASSIFRRVRVELSRETIPFENVDIKLWSPTWLTVEFDKNRWLRSPGTLEVRVKWDSLLISDPYRIRVKPRVLFERANEE